jgi:hypothetical protein
VLLSLTLFEMLFYSWQQLPFTCSYTPGKRPLILIVGGYLGVLGMIVPVLSLWVRAGSEFIELFPVYLAFFGGIWIWARVAEKTVGATLSCFTKTPRKVCRTWGFRLTWRGHAAE